MTNVRDTSKYTLQASLCGQNVVAPVYANVISSKVFNNILTPNLLNLSSVIFAKKTSGSAPGLEQLYL